MNLSIYNSGHTWAFGRTGEPTSLVSLKHRWLEIYFRKYNLELQLFKTFGMEIQSWNLLRRNLTWFKCLLQYHVFFNCTGIQLVFGLGKELTENDYLLFCDVL